MPRKTAMIPVSYTHLRVNEEMSQRVESCRTDFDNIQEQLKECSVTLAEADDLIYVHKAKAAKRRMEKLREQMAELELSLIHILPI